MKTYPITLWGALRSMAISASLIWSEYRREARMRRTTEREAKRRARRQLAALRNLDTGPTRPMQWINEPRVWPQAKRREFDELKSPAWIGAMTLAVVVAIIDLADAWAALGVQP